MDNQFTGDPVDCFCINCGCKIGTLKYATQTIMSACRDDSNVYGVLKMKKVLDARIIDGGPPVSFYNRCARCDLEDVPDSVERITNPTLAIIKNMAERMKAR